MVATLLSLWIYVAPVPGPAPDLVAVSWPHDPVVRLDDPPSAQVLIWPLDDESDASRHRGRPEPILTEGEGGDGAPVDACPPGHPDFGRVRDLGRVLASPDRPYRVPPSGRSPVLRC